MMFTAASFIGFLGANQNDWIIVMRGLTVHEALCSTGFLAADDADRMKFGHFLGHSQQSRHGAKRFATKIHIQPGQDNTNPAASQRFSRISDTGIKELYFINSDNRSGRIEMLQNLAGMRDRLRINILTVMAGHMLNTVPVIKVGFKDLYRLSGNDSAANTADKLFSFAAEHTAADDFNSTGMVKHQKIPFKYKGQT
jgi:hypothetical protein